MTDPETGSQHARQNEGGPIFPGAMASTEHAAVRLEPCTHGTVMPGYSTLSAPNTKSIFTEPPPAWPITLSTHRDQLHPLLFASSVSASLYSCLPLFLRLTFSDMPNSPIADSVPLSLPVSSSSSPQALSFLLCAALSRKQGTTYPVSPSLLSCFSAGPDRSG